MLNAGTHKINDKEARLSLTTPRDGSKSIARFV